MACRYRTQSKTGSCLLKRLVLLGLKQMSPKLQVLDLGAAAGVTHVLQLTDHIPACFFQNRVGVSFWYPITKDCLGQCSPVSGQHKKEAEV